MMYKVQMRPILTPNLFFSPPTTWLYFVSLKSRIHLCDLNISLPQPSFCSGFELGMMVEL